jgi:DHA1 family multidrug resistance protein-like MFS transporter
MIFSGMILTVIADFIFAVSPYLNLLYIARFIGGIGLGIMIPSVLAYVSDVTSNDTRAKGMGYLSAAMNLGMVLGPGIGGIIANFGIRVPYFFAAALGVASTLLTLILPETLPKDKRTTSKGAEQQESIVKQLVQSVHTSYFRYLLLIFIMTFGLVNYETVYSLFVEQKYGFTTQEVSVLITIGAVIGIIVQVGLIDKVIKRFGEYKTIRISLVMAAIALVLMLLKVNFIYLILVSAVFFTFNSFLRPTVNTMLSKEADDQQGFVSGLNNMYTSFGNIIGPILAGKLFDKQINLPYMFGAIILLATTCLVRKENKIQNNEVIVNER